MAERSPAFQFYPGMEQDCPRCKARGKPKSFDSDPRCAFTSGVFSGDNWQCATINELRDLAYKRETCHRVDDVGLGVVAFDVEDVVTGFVVMSWYKSRGRTDQAVVMRDDDTNPPQPLTLELADVVLRSEGK